MSVHEHKQEAPSAVRCKVITVSDTRTKETDKSGRVMMDFLREAGFETVAYDIVKDEKDELQKAVLSGCMDEYTDAVLLNGGTGIAERDVTIEAVTPLFSKELPGFGELFRMLSYTEDIGSAAILHEHRRPRLSHCQHGTRGISCCQRPPGSDAGNGRRRLPAGHRTGTNLQGRVQGVPATVRN